MKTWAKDVLGLGIALTMVLVVFGGIVVYSMGNADSSSEDLGRIVLNTKELKNRDGADSTSNSPGRVVYIPDTLPQPVAIRNATVLVIRTENSVPDPSLIIPYVPWECP